MAVAVAVAADVCGGGAVVVAVAGLTKKQKSHERKFLNQCLGFYFLGFDFFLCQA